MVNNVFNIDKQAESMEKLEQLYVAADPELGALVTPEAAAFVTEKNPIFQVIPIDGTGHNIRREQYPAFMAAVNRFLAEA